MLHYNRCFQTRAPDAAKSASLKIEPFGCTALPATEASTRAATPENEPSLACVSVGTRVLHSAYALTFTSAAVAAQPARTARQRARMELDEDIMVAIALQCNTGRWQAFCIATPYRSFTLASLPQRGLFRVMQATDLGKPALRARCSALKSCVSSKAAQCHMQSCLIMVTLVLSKDLLKSITCSTLRASKCITMDIIMAIHGLIGCKGVSIRDCKRNPN